jgi:hypothetical protein
MVRINIFLRLLDYRVNLADEIDANIQRLVSRSSAARMLERRTSTSSSTAKQRNLSPNKNREHNDDHRHPKHTAPPPTALGGETIDETMENSDVNYINDEDENSKKISPVVNATARELSTKFRTLVLQHRKMIKQLHEADEFVPFLDRKVKTFSPDFVFHEIFIGE